MPATAKIASGTPTPMPALAPVLNPESIEPFLDVSFCDDEAAVELDPISECDPALVFVLLAAAVVGV